MGDPIQNLSQVSLRDHPALEEFLLRIYHDRHSLPPLSEIEVTNQQGQDGLVDVSYLDRENHRIYALRLNGQNNSMYYNPGTLDAHGRPHWQYVRNVPGEVIPMVCSTVHTLGGNQEDRFTCQDFSLSESNSTRRGYQTYAALGWWSTLEVGGRLMRQGSFTRGLIAGLRPLGTSEFTASQRLWQTAPGIGMGLGAMLLSDPIADALHLDPQAHLHERWALAASMGQGANLLTHWTQHRFPAFTPTEMLLANGKGGGNLLSRLETLEITEAQLAASLRGGNPLPLAASQAELTQSGLVTRRTLRPMSFASGLLSSALIDATLGQYFQEGSPERFALRAGGFFLPQVFRSFVGERALALSERRGVAGVTKWGGRAIVTAFWADVAFMGYNYFHNGSTASGRENLIYARANEIQRGHQHPIVSFFDGVAEALAPSLAQHYLIGDDDVAVARSEFQGQANQTGNRVGTALRQLLLFNPLGRDTDPEFYRHLDWSLFRGDNRIVNVRRPDGSLLPVADVYEQISDPDIYRRRIENATPAEQIRYIQQQFRGHRLSEGDVREILGRIAIHRLREDIAQLYFLDTPDHQPLLRCFDEHGALRAGQETAFLAHVFPEADRGEVQIMALRQVALVNHLRALENAGRSAELATYRNVARELGLMDAGGHWTSGGNAGEIVENGLALFDRHPVSLSAPEPVSPRPTQRELLLQIIHRSPGSSTPG